MKAYTKMTAEERRAELDALRTEYDAIRAKGRKLDMARGKPNAKQLDLSMDLLTIDPAELITAEDGTDTRNYGVLAGLPECRRLFGDLLGVAPENVIIGGQSSLSLMYDAIAKAMLLGVYGGTKPWGQQGELKFLCPVPGYDRHFAITREFGIRMINIPMDENGPDMELVRDYVETDPAVKGIWCVPKYSNPSGITYSDDTVRAFAALKPAADDFRIFWDNAYLVHGFEEEDDHLLNIFDACREAGSEDMVYEFASTSKITFPGAGVSVMAASAKNVEFLLKQLGIQSISYDKLNQMRHVKFFGSADAITEHMKRHAAFMRPKFAVVLDALQAEIAPREIGSWPVPKGGYFVGFKGLSGTAKRTVTLCKEAGLTLTAAGAPFPYGMDPDDSIIRIAPSYPDIPDLEAAIKLFCLSARIAALEVLA